METSHLLAQWRVPDKSLSPGLTPGIGKSMQRAYRRPISSVESCRAQFTVVGDEVPLFDSWDGICIKLLFEGSPTSGELTPIPSSKNTVRLRAFGHLKRREQAVHADETDHQ